MAAAVQALTVVLLEMDLGVLRDKHGLSTTRLRRLSFTGRFTAD